MQKIITLSIALIIALVSLLGFAEVYSTAEEVIKNIFPQLQKFEGEDYIFERQPVKVFTVFSDGKVIGWAVVLDKMGKIKPITFLVGIDTEGKVIGVHILEYRDMFGSEIKRKSFLRQFQGKSIKNQLVIGRDIDAVTSATISSQAATQAVKKSLELIEKLKEDF